MRPKRPNVASGRLSLSTLKKNTRAHWRDTTHALRNISLTSFFALAIPVLLTIYFVRFVTPHFSPPPTPQPASARTHINQCSVAVPQPLLHFDPASDPSFKLQPSIFSAFFKEFLFEPTSDVVLPINTTSSVRPEDVHNALQYSQRALRLFFDDESITVSDYKIAYFHINRASGLRYIFYLQSSSNSNPHRHDVVAIQRTFDGACNLSVRTLAPSQILNPLYMLVPYSNRPSRLKWFLHQFDDLRRQGVQVKLILAVCKETPSNINSARELVSELEHAKDVTIEAVSGDSSGYFSRAVAIRDGSKPIPHNSIMFISDIDMNMFAPMFDSCRSNCIQGSQVYFPVFYSLFAHGIRVSRNAGYWRTSSYGMSCMYKSDFDALNTYGKAEHKFVGWGGEDKALYSAFQSTAQYKVFRAVEPALRHKWHPKECDPLTPSYRDCLSILFQQLGKTEFIGPFLLNKKIDLQKMLHDSLAKDTSKEVQLAAEQNDDVVANEVENDGN